MGVIFLNEVQPFAEMLLFRVHECLLNYFDIFLLYSNTRCNIQTQFRDVDLSPFTTFDTNAALS